MELSIKLKAYKKVDYSTLSEAECTVSIDPKNLNEKIFQVIFDHLYQIITAEIESISVQD